MDAVQLMTASGAAALISKLVVDGVKMGVDLPRWGPVLLAFLAAQAAEFLLLTAQGAQFNTQSMAQAGLIGIFAWGTAIGTTELQKRANRTEEKINVALQSEPGTTRKQLESKV